jgi:ribonuclease BN (tRNA processing enzyme)
VRVMVCGARGSLPAPGAAFVRHGGETACVALSRDGDPPTLVLDAGTGLRRLARELGEEPFRGTILLTHLHWDHTHGLPFFPPGERDGARVRVMIPAQGDAEEVLSRAISPPHFPVSPSQLRGDWTFDGIEPGEHELEGFSVRVREVPHKGGRTFGYRVADGGPAVTYVPDHDPRRAGPGPDGLGEYHDAVRALCEGAGLLLHDAHRTAAEMHADPELGHSAMEYAIGLARECGLPDVRLFHHAPERTDDELDELAASLGVPAAVEGDAVEL